MTELWQGSLACRLWQGFLALCRSSFVGGLLHKLRQSAFAAWVRRLLLSPPAVQSSVLARCESGWNRLLWRFGQRLSENGFPAEVIPFRNGYHAVGVCSTDDVVEMYRSLQRLKRQAFCPKNVWILTNE